MYFMNNLTIPEDEFEIIKYIKQYKGNKQID